jgi:hypothetical protein
MDTPSNINVSAVSEAALERAAQLAVANAVASAFAEDPVIGADLSRAISVLGSVVKRHGLLLQKTLADALAASDRFDVLVDVALPVTEAAHELLLGKNSVEDLARISIRADSAAARIVTADIVVIDPEAGWAGAYDVKRGNGATESRRRRPIEHDLRATRLILASYLGKRGYENITSVTTGVIDYYGSSGFSKELKIERDELDVHFGVPVEDTLDVMTVKLRRALHAELPNLFGDALRSIRRDVSKTKETAAVTVELAQNHCTEHVTVQNLLNARPAGPGPRKQPAYRMPISGAA